MEPKLLLKMKLPLTEKGSWFGIEVGRDERFGTILLSLRYSCLNVEIPSKHVLWKDGFGDKNLGDVRTHLAPKTIGILMRSTRE